MRLFAFILPPGVLENDVRGRKLDLVGFTHFTLYELEPALGSIKYGER